MIKVLIVDDEPNVRLGLKKIIPWTENGFSVCGEGMDAEDGLKQISKLKPDIVLIDIKMPGGLGTEVIREARKKGFKGEFIILSGYSNFEYAKDAIKYGVRSYILKPIDEDELLEALLHLKKEIDSNKNVSIETEESELVNLILGKEIYNLKYYNSDESLQAVLIDFEEESLKEDIENIEIIESELKRYEDIALIKLDRYSIAIFKNYKEERVENTLMSLLKKFTGVENIFIAVGKSVNGRNNLRKSYLNAKYLMERKFFYLENRIITNEDIKKDMDKSTLSINKELDKIFSYAEVNDFRKLEKITLNLENVILHCDFSENEIRSILIKGFLDNRDILLKNYSVGKSKLKDNEKIIHEVYSKNSLKSTIRYLVDDLCKLTSEVSMSTSDSSAKRVLKYMKKNYYKDLKLESIAEIFNYNSAYLGKLLKNETGENFNTHLDKIRIERAKYLLVEEKLKVYQVCEKVGYKNIDYFHSKFKKYVGISPLNYKKQYESSEKII